MGISWEPGATMNVIPGQEIRGVVRFRYRGPRQRVWVGIGPTAHLGDRPYQWIGGYADVGPDADWHNYEGQFSGNLSVSPPDIDQNHECWVWIGSDAGTGEIEKETLDHPEDTFHYIGPEFEIISAAFT